MKQHTLHLQAVQKRATQLATVVSLNLITHPAWANLPTPPSYEYAQDGDWLRTGQAIGNKAVHIFLIFMAVALMTGVFAGILRGYQSAQERQEMSHFFKAVGVGLICLALGLGLLYGASLVVGSQ